MRNAEHLHLPRTQFILAYTVHTGSGGSAANLVLWEGGAEGVGGPTLVLGPTAELGRRRRRRGMQLGPPPPSPTSYSFTLLKQQGVEHAADIRIPSHDLPIPTVRRNWQPNWYIGNIGECFPPLPAHFLFPICRFRAGGDVAFRSGACVGITWLPLFLFLWHFYSIFLFFCCAGKRRRLSFLSSSQIVIVRSSPPRLFPFHLIRPGPRSQGLKGSL